MLFPYLLIVTSRDLEDISLEVISERVTQDFMRDALVIERAQLVLILDLDDLLATGRRVRNVKLHTNRPTH
jgi:hypothetical protein